MSWRVIAFVSSRSLSGAKGKVPPRSRRASRGDAARQSRERDLIRGIYLHVVHVGVTATESREVSVNYGVGRIKGSLAAGTRNFISTQAA